LKAFGVSEMSSVRGREEGPDIRGAGRALIRIDALD
jgi:hypothetical protein